MLRLLAFLCAAVSVWPAADARASALPAPFLTAPHVASTGDALVSLQPDGSVQVMEADGALRRSIVPDDGCELWHIGTRRLLFFCGEYAGDDLMYPVQIADTRTGRTWRTTVKGEPDGIGPHWVQTTYNPDASYHGESYVFLDWRTGEERYGDPRRPGEWDLDGPRPRYLGKYVRAADGDTVVRSSWRPETGDRLRVHRHGRTLRVASCEGFCRDVAVHDDVLTFIARNDGQRPWTPRTLVRIRLRDGKSWRWRLPLRGCPRALRVRGTLLLARSTEPQCEGDVRLLRLWP